MMKPIKKRKTSHDASASVETRQTATVTNLNLGVCHINQSGYTLIPDGVYTVAFDYYETAFMFNKAPKLILKFHVVDNGDFFEKLLYRFYNVKRLFGRPKKYGNFKVGLRSDFIFEYANLFGFPKRVDRVPMGRYKDELIKVKTKTVVKNHNQKSIPEGLQYSVISELLEVVHV